MRILLIALAVVATIAPAQAQPCMKSTRGALVCGHGDDALTILAETRSPTGQFAVGWRQRTGAPRTGLPDVRYVEEHLVRLADGRSLGRVVGRAWNDGEMQSNKLYLTTSWSPDERWLIVADVGQESLVDLAVYAVDPAGSVREQNLLDVLKAAADPKLRARVGRKMFEQYELQIPDNAVIALTNAGNARLPLEFRIPKQDKRHDLVATFALSRRDGRIAVSPIDIRFKAK